MALVFSSINFQKSTGYAISHNFRKSSEKEAKYLLPKEERRENEYWQFEKNGKELFTEELAKAERKGGKIPKLENSLWEGVLNLNERHSIDDVKKVAEHIEKKYNIKCYAIAIHRDEGYIKTTKETNKKTEETIEKKETKYNLHAHLNFCTYKDGKQNWQQGIVRPTLSKLQTEIAEILFMPRGQENSKERRLEHREYKARMRERDKFDQDYKELFNRHEDLKEKIQKNNNTPKVDNNEVSRLKSDRDYYKMQYEIYQENYEKEKEAHNSTKNQFQDKNDELDRLNQQNRNLSNLNAENQRLKEEDEKKKKKIAELEEKLTLKEKIIQNLTAQVQKLQNFIDGLTKKQDNQKSYTRSR